MIRSSSSFDYSTNNRVLLLYDSIEEYNESMIFCLCFDKFNHYLALASNPATSHQHSSTNNPTMSPLFNNAPMSLSNPNNPLARLQETGNEQAANPFDLKIKRPVLKGTL